MPIFRITAEKPRGDWARNIQDIIDEMYNRTYFEFRRSGCWQPATNVYEASEAYFVCVDLAGLESRQVHIECVDDRRVIITGHRGKPRPAGHEGPLSVHVMEIDEGPFQREVELPVAVNAKAIEVEYVKGYLWIRLPKTT